MAGLINNVVEGIPVAGYTPEKAEATQAQSQGYNPTATNVTSNQTVQGQLGQIIAQDSPLMQQAAKRANQAANSKGLLNSSMAVGAGQEAVLSAATPIAQADAGTYFQANQKTVDAQNAEANFRAAAANQSSLANAQLGTDVSKSNAAMGNEAGMRLSDSSNQASLAKLDVVTRQGLAALDATTRTELAQLDASTRESLASLDAQTRIQVALMDQNTRVQLTQMENGYRQLLQANQSAASAYQQTVNAIANISIQNTMDANTKNNAITTQLNMLNQALKATAEIARKDDETVGSLDLSQYFQNYNFAPTSGAIGNVSF